MVEKKPNWALRALAAVWASDATTAYILLGMALADFVNGHRLEGTIAMVGGAICIAIHRAAKIMFSASVGQVLAALVTRNG